MWKRMGQVVLAFGVAGQAQADDLSFQCSFASGTTITATSDEQTFAQPFDGLFTPTTDLVTGAQPDYFLLADAKLMVGDVTTNFRMFISDWVEQTQLSTEALEMLTQFGVNPDTLSQVRIGIPTDLAQRLFYAEILGDDGTVSKVAFAGQPAQCD